jgi:hypothetical protein
VKAAGLHPAAVLPLYLPILHRCWQQQQQLLLLLAADGKRAVGAA